MEDLTFYQHTNPPVSYGASYDSVRYSTSKPTSNSGPSSEEDDIGIVTRQETIPLGVDEFGEGFPHYKECGIGVYRSDIISSVLHEPQDTFQDQKVYKKKLARKSRDPYSKKVCSFCRRRKKKCDGGEPCSYCVTKGNAANCTYTKEALPVSKLLTLNAAIAMISTRGELVGLYTGSLIPSLGAITQEISLFISDITTELFEEGNFPVKDAGIFGLRVIAAISASYMGCDDIAHESVEISEAEVDSIYEDAKAGRVPEKKLALFIVGLYHLNYYFYCVCQAKSEMYGRLALDVVDTIFETETGFFKEMRVVLQSCVNMCTDHIPLSEKMALFCCDASCSQSWDNGKMNPNIQLTVSDIVKLRVGKLTVPRLYTLVQRLGIDTVSYVDREIVRFRTVHPNTEVPVALLTVRTDNVQCMAAELDNELMEDVMFMINLMTTSALDRKNVQAHEVAFTAFSLLSIRARALEAAGLREEALSSAQLAVTLSEKCRLSVMHPGYVTCFGLIVEVLLRHNDETTMGYLTHIMGQYLLKKEGGEGSMYPNVHLRALWWICSSRCSGEALSAGKMMLQQLRSP